MTKSYSLKKFLDVDFCSSFDSHIFDLIVEADILFDKDKQSETDKAAKKFEELIFKMAIKQYDCEARYNNFVKHIKNKINCGELDIEKFSDKIMKNMQNY
jgi:hypothetical protein